ncbi:pilus assembly protein TadG-related protein [Pseudomonas proteolytica]|uniref:pilus assembly protein TadG-related protein n=1 Tax=Pseudomonas proteolytica TaxID=219574 RepID=UPI001472C27F|nr:pilus assembly protein TadG-related protein [Pseudomonas proteolytica]NMZ37140.1 hypothetical protein [Pseudomonas proteolytica]
MSPRLRSGQRGAIGLVFAGTLALALVFLLLVVDSGRLYLEKRKLQAVADTAALEAANRGGQCAGSTTAVDYAKQNATRNGFTVVANDPSRALAVTCGTLLTNAANTRVFTVDSTKNDAIRVVASRTVSTGIANGVWRLFSGTYNADTTLTATAVAALAPPVAQLTIRSTAVVVDTNKALILSKLFGGLLGGNLSVSLAGWNGLITSNISLLGYLDRLKLDLGLTAVGYSEVLGNTINVSQLVQSAINVMDPNGTLGATATIASLQAIKLAAGATKVVLGDALHIESGTDVAGLAANMRVFDLIQGFVQLANKKNGLVASFPISLGPSIAQIDVSVQVLQPPQLSAIGNPAHAIAPGHNPQTGPYRIYVQTAQLRTRLSVNLPVLNTVSDLLAAATGLAGPVLTIVKGLVGLDLSVLTCAVSCISPYPQVLPPDIGIDIELDAASASSWVTGYSCATPTNKSLTTATNTSLVNLRMGKIPYSSVFGPSPPTVVVNPMKVIDIGTRKCTLLIFCDAPVPSVGGGIGLTANIQILATNNIPHTYFSPDLPEITQQPYYYGYTTTNIVSGLTDPVTGAAAGLTLNMYAPTPGNENLLGSLITGLGTIFNTVTTELIKVIKATLSPLLDSLINTLLLALGVDLNKVDVGANLSCHSGRAYLVI